MKSGVQPWIGCGCQSPWLAAGACSAPRSCGTPPPTSWALAGSLRMILVSGRSRRSTRATPVTVPPVPQPRHPVVEPLAGEVGEDLTRGGVLVHLRIVGGLELPREEPAVGLRQLHGLHVHAEPLRGARREHDLGAEEPHQLRRSIEKLSAIVTTSGYPFAAQTMASPIPVLPLVASTTVWPGLRSPRRSASSMMLIARRSFTDEAGLNELRLHVHPDVRRCQTVDADARRVADRVDDAVVETAATLGSCANRATSWLLLRARGGPADGATELRAVTSLCSREPGKSNGLSLERIPEWLSRCDIQVRSLGWRRRTRRQRSSSSGCSTKTRGGGSALPLPRHLLAVSILEQIAGGALEDPAQLLQRREADRSRLAGLEDRQVLHRDSRPAPRAR